MKKTHKKKFKSIYAIILIMFSGILILSGCGNKIKKQMETAINDINSGKYTEAKKEIDTILKEDSNNSEANVLNNIISGFENAKKLYEDKEYSKANEEISKIPSEYSKYNIKNDIENLKSNINKKLDEIKQIDSKINDLNKLINDGKLDEANKKLSELKDRYITEEQNKKINELKGKLDKKIEQKKAEEKKAKEEQKKREEEKKLEIEKQKKQTEENLKKNSSNSKITKNNKEKNNAKNQGNIHYVNNNFGIQMELPASWRGKYYVRESGNTISFIYKTPKNKNVIGILLYIEKLNKNYNRDEIMMDDLEIKEINGVKYAIGGSTDIGTNAYDMGEFEIYKEYNKLEKERGLIYRTIRSNK